MSRPKSRAPLVRALIALAVIAGALFFAITEPARLGLDLRGGTQIVLETKDSAVAEANAESTDRAIEVLNRRVDALGIGEFNLARSGQRRIIVEMPGVQDPREAAEVIGKTAQLTFHPVLGAGDPTKPIEEQKPETEGERILADEDGQPIRIGPAAITGEKVGDASAQRQQQGLGQWIVAIDFKGEGSRQWADLTGKAACNAPGDPTRRVAIVLDDQVISSPQVDPSIACQVGIPGGTTEITGSFTAETADDLAVLIRGGALPVPVEIIEQRTVGPTLGKEAIDASFKAAVIGIILTGLFIVIVYRLVGFLSAIALACYALISYAALVALGATLTLPGLAGFVLAIGMAIDANVLVFERAREEYTSANRGLSHAIRVGFEKAWSAIIDSNITTLLAAGLLFFLASGPVRGFGVTLSIGVLASMVSALIITRVFVEFALKRKPVAKHPKVTGISALGRAREVLLRRNPDLMKYGRRWLALAGVLLIIAIAGVVVRGPNFGLEFTGGRLVEYSTTTPISVDQAREAVSDAGFPRAVVQESGDDDIAVRTGKMSNEEEAKIRAALAETSGGEVTKQRDELIGPSLGKELRIKALIALAVALAAQLLYLAIRFRWTFATAAVVAMTHDVIILIGVFAWLGKPIDGVFLAALLTVIGYSVNDSVVVFDRIRELWGQNRKMPFAQVVNRGILQTIPRTINTGVGALFILGALAFLGGDSLTDFAIALLLGIGVGTWSSMFAAGPLAIELEKRNAAPPPAAKPERKQGPARKRADSGAVL